MMINLEVGSICWDSWKSSWFSPYLKWTGAGYRFQRTIKHEICWHDRRCRRRHRRSQSTDGRLCRSLLLYSTSSSDDISSVRDEFQSKDARHSVWPCTKQWNLTTYLLRISKSIVFPATRNSWHSDVVKFQTSTDRRLMHYRVAGTMVVSNRAEYVDVNRSRRIAYAGYKLALRNTWCIPWRNEHWKPCTSSGSVEQLGIRRKRTLT